MSIFSRDIQDQDSRLLDIKDLLQRGSWTYLSYFVHTSISILSSASYIITSIDKNEVSICKQLFG